MADLHIFTKGETAYCVYKGHLIAWLKSLGSVFKTFRGDKLTVTETYITNGSVTLNIPKSASRKPVQFRREPLPFPKTSTKLTNKDDFLTAIVLGFLPNEGVLLNSYGDITVRIIYVVPIDYKRLTLFNIELLYCSLTLLTFTFNSINEVVWNKQYIGWYKELFGVINPLYWQGG